METEIQRMKELIPQLRQAAKAYYQESREIMDILRQVQDKFKTGEVFPTDPVPVLMEAGAELAPEVMVWGYPGVGGKGRAIINARIPRVVFGAPDPKAGSCGSVTDLFALPYNHHPACEGGVLEEECAQLLRDFFRALRLAPPKPRWKPAVLPAQGGDHA